MWILQEGVIHKVLQIQQADTQNCFAMVQINVCDIIIGYLKGTGIQVTDFMLKFYIPFDGGRMVPSGNFSGGVA